MLDRIRVHLVQEVVRNSDSRLASIVLQTRKRIASFRAVDRFVEENNLDD